MNDCPTGFETRAVLVATGAGQNPLILPGWTLPGVITAGAAQTMINVHRVLPGHQAVIIGIDPLGLAVAQLLGSCVSGRVTCWAIFGFAAFRWSGKFSRLALYRMSGLPFFVTSEKKRVHNRKSYIKIVFKWSS